MKKVLAIVFSDLHINDWSKFNQDNKRTQDHFRVLSLIKEACLKYECPALFCGDLFHKPENISNSRLSLVFGAFDKLTDNSKFEIYGISGNHDMVKVAKPGELPLSWFNTFASKYNFLNSLDVHNKNIHTYDHCYKEVSSELYAYKQLLKPLSENASAIQDICNNAINCDEISCDGKNITIKAGKQAISVESTKW